MGGGPILSPGGIQSKISRMSAPLIPCGDCGRHVRIIESACPFCGVAVVAEGVAVAQRPKVRLGRAAMFTVGAAMLAVAGCGDDGGDTDGGPSAAYGAPPIMDSSPGDASPPDASLPDASNAPLYGAPPPADGG